MIVVPRAISVSLRGVLSVIVVPSTDVKEQNVLRIIACAGNILCDKQLLSGVYVRRFMLQLNDMYRATRLSVSTIGFSVIQNY